jgi:uncharacterized protein (TIGR03437 family)
MRLSDDAVRAFAAIMTCAMRWDVSSNSVRTRLFVVLFVAARYWFGYHRVMRNRNGYRLIRPVIIMILGLAVAAVSALGQSSSPNTIIGAGYLFPAPIMVAPGQLITIFAKGVGSTLKQPAFATGSNLPSSLAGVTITIGQDTNIPAPILEVRPAAICPNCGAMTAITVQIPYELKLPPQNGLFGGAFAFVTENGAAGNWTILSPAPDQVHILTDCDTVIGGSGPSTGRCPWEVTHANGTLVSSASPASPGEALVVYAVGLGATNPAVNTGQPATKPTPTVGRFLLSFDFRVNALPSAFSFSEIVSSATPLYTGLTPGYAGLYQINFVVPDLAPGLPPCGSGQGSSFVNTNLTVTVIGQTSFDSAAICVSIPK